ncbi:MAG TPA: biotin/lipoyl-binding protein, partial [Nitrospiria bacterium]|nr:biotin/lipoyl-binding protein [Nitrospiria bacterium]
MGKSKKWFWAAATLVVLAGAAWGIQKFSGATPAAQSSGGPAKFPPTLVEASPVRVGALAQEVDAVGSLKANESVLIRSEIAGRITAIRFAEGARIEKGTVLVQIDSAEYQAQVDQISASLELARLNFER